MCECCEGAEDVRFRVRWSEVACDDAAGVSD